VPFRSFDGDDWWWDLSAEERGRMFPAEHNDAGESADGSDDRDLSAELLPVSIYIADEAIHEQIEQAVVDLLAFAGLRVERRDDPVSGSWFRRMWAAVIRSVHAPLAKEAAQIAAHAADTRLVLAQDAVVTATLMQNLGPVIASLQPTKDAVIRIGAVLIVKVDGVVTVCQLTAAQQLELDHRPKLALSPTEIITALNAQPAREVSPSELT
jgi:hypothetical protein